MTITSTSPVRRAPRFHATFTASGIIDAYGLGGVPARSPYKAGDWIRQHGYLSRRSNSSDHAATGFRGIVLGGMGSTLLRGLTDDGHEWAEHWGALTPDGPCDCRGPWCACCPHPQRFPAPVHVDVQLSLFDMAAA